jgi:hypothetical protein
VVERVGGSRRPQRVSADLEPEQCRIGPHQSIDAISGDLSALLHSNAYPAHLTQ